MAKQIVSSFLVMGLSLAAGRAMAQPAPEPASPTQGQAMFMLDYQVIPVPGSKSIDLMGFHLLNKMNDWLYLGFGGYAPLFKGDYGGFMAVDVTGHVQRKVVGDLFADAGVSLGGGGGGKSVQQSKVLSGTGGFAKAYVGLGYDFKDFSAGVNYSKIKFSNSAIDHSQLNLYVQVPFDYAVAPFASSGDRLLSAGSPNAGALASSGENMLTLGLDNYSQIRPEGSNKNTIGVADLQFSHFITKDSYWYVDVGVGFRGLPLYNQVLGGLGHRFVLSPNVNLYGQVAVGSGGYAPDTIDTGPGLLVFPKLTAEYMLSKNLGVALSAGYLFAPKGSSKNYTVGASLNYHIFPADGGSGPNDGAGGRYAGYRFHVFQQSEFDVSRRGASQDRINLLSLQADNIVNDHLFVPVQVSVAYNAYLGYPGYGELLAGVGVQNKYDKDSRFQAFGQLLVGTNVHGAVVKTGIGLNVGLSDRLAIYGLAGQTFGIDKDRFRSNYAGLGLSYRFSVPSR